MKPGERIRVSGIVQGVGFRPTVWRLANDCGLVGRVWNDSEGVGIEAWAEQAELDAFVDRLRAEQPPLARIDAVEREPLPESEPSPEAFTIQTSREGEIRTGVAADAATCSKCLSDIFDPNNRRYRYPFTNCTHCGPRLSIVRAIPYDRANTSMSAFPMCPDCQGEYEDPADRRFHAQPNACQVCGPQVWIEDANGRVVEPEDDCDFVESAARLIRAGHIVAVKGIGGIHLACDAGNPAAVDALRERKHRYQKALALMARDMAMVCDYAWPDEQEQALLQDQAAPIVVLQADTSGLASGIAPGQDSLGFMLPYTPLHHLLMQQMQRPIVLTSGNRSDEPQVIDNRDAHSRLERIADYYLLHDRDIVNRLDDSVIRMGDGSPRFLRRARGYAPQSLLLIDALNSDKAILAMGGELKNTFCLLKQGKAIVSQHMGDLEDAVTYDDYEKNLALYHQLYDFTPDVIVVDRHPNYRSTHLGQQMAAERGSQLLEVQHHHAHIASGMAEHGVKPGDGRVLGIALDGLGYGDDGTIWGGEFLLCDYTDFERVGHFQSVAMPGGTQAILQPWRNAFAHLSASLGWDQVVSDHADLELVTALADKPLIPMQQMIDKGLNSPLASSAGRLFDAVAATLGICRDSVSYEGQAAIELEALARPHIGAVSTSEYAYDWDGCVLSWAPLWSALLSDLENGADRGLIAARFHVGLAHAITEVAAGLCSSHDVDRVVLNGGVVQNRLLLEGVGARLRRQGLAVLSPTKLPANDGGLSLGQAAIATASFR